MNKEQLIQLLKGWKYDEVFVWFKTSQGDGFPVSLNKNEIISGLEKLEPDNEVNIKVDETIDEFGFELLVIYL